MLEVLTPTTLADQSHQLASFIVTVGGLSLRLSRWFAQSGRIISSFRQMPCIVVGRSQSVTIPMGELSIDRITVPALLVE